MASRNAEIDQERFCGVDQGEAKADGEKEALDSLGMFGGPSLVQKDSRYFI